MRLLTHEKLVIPERLKPAFAKVKDFIERDDFRSADMKKLTSSRYFRLKLDYDARLLVTFVQSPAGRACLGLELIEKHAYERSRFLRGARVTEEDIADTSSAIETETAPVPYLNPRRSEFHFLDKPLSFDDHQAKLQHLRLPLILVGCAGSGKTALTLTKLRELSGDVLYVTQSAFLAENAANLYHSHGYRNEGQSVTFLSYRALLESVRVPRGRPVTLSDFRDFFARHSQGLKFTTPHQLFEELRGVIGAAAGAPLALADYLELGVRQSVYTSEQRSAVYQAFSKYRVWLEEQQLYDTNLVAHAYAALVEPQFDAAVVDEIQDLTSAELTLVLAALKNQHEFLLCGDANQIVHPNFFSWSALKRLFYSSEEAAVSAPIHVLEANYRSSRAVCELANQLLKLKNARFGSIDRESTALVRPASDRPGKLIGLTKKDAVLRELNQRTKSSAKVAVIVLGPEQKQEARQKFSTPLVFSVHEAKGLEYDSVILYDLVSSERQRFREVCDGVQAQTLASDDLVYARVRDKTDKSLEVYKFFVNALYVALTRAVEALYIVESDAAHPLLALLGIRCGEDVSGVDKQSSTIDEWQREARRLELQGKSEQAAAIRRGVLRTEPVPWPVVDAATFRQSHERIFTAGGAFAKAQQRLYEFACFHGLGALGYRIKYEAGYTQGKSFELLEDHVRGRAMGHYLARDHSKVLGEVARYGVDHQSLPGLTPLMMAAAAGDAELCEILLDRGASIEVVDPLGRMPVHFALRRSLTDHDFAQTQLGPLFERLCPVAFDIELDDRRLRIGRNQGEFTLLLVLVARIHQLYRTARRSRAFNTEMLSEEWLRTLPTNIVPEERRRRVYWNGVLARVEVGASYRPARKLLRRERTGHYLPSDVRLRVAGQNGAPDRYVPLPVLLGLDLIDSASFGNLEATPRAIEVPRAAGDRR
jgi:hypothetical protein